MSNYGTGNLDILAEISLDTRESWHKGAWGRWRHTCCAHIRYYSSLVALVNVNHLDNNEQVYVWTLEGELYAFILLEVKGSIW